MCVWVNVCVCVCVCVFVCVCVIFTLHFFCLIMWTVLENVKIRGKDLWPCHLAVALHVSWFQQSTCLSLKMSSNGLIPKGCPKMHYSRKLWRYSYIEFLTYLRMIILIIPRRLRVLVRFKKKLWANHKGFSVKFCEVI